MQYMLSFFVTLAIGSSGAIGQRTVLIDSTIEQCRGCEFEPHLEQLHFPGAMVQLGDVKCFATPDGIDAAVAILEEEYDIWEY